MTETALPLPPELWAVALSLVTGALFLLGRRYGRQVHER